MQRRGGTGASSAGIVLMLVTLREYLLCVLVNSPGASVSCSALDHWGEHSTEHSTEHSREHPTEPTIQARGCRLFKAHPLLGTPFFTQRTTNKLKVIRWHKVVCLGSW